MQLLKPPIRRHATSHRFPVVTWLAVILSAMVVAGCATTAPIGESPTDPFESHGQ